MADDPADSAVTVSHSTPAPAGLHAGKFPRSPCPCYNRGMSKRQANWLVGIVTLIGDLAIADGTWWLFETGGSVGWGIVASIASPVPICRSRKELQ